MYYCRLKIIIFICNILDYTIIEFTLPNNEQSKL